MAGDFRFKNVLVGSKNHEQLMKRILDAVQRGAEVNYEEERAENPVPVDQEIQQKNYGCRLYHRGLPYYEVRASGYVREAACRK